MLTALATLLLISLVVLLHEGGHYLAARHMGIQVLKFSIGFGRRLWSVRVGETVFAISAIPLGGYVRVAGTSDLSERPAAAAPPSGVPRAHGPPAPTTSASLYRVGRCRGLVSRLLCWPLAVLMLPVSAVELLAGGLARQLRGEAASVDAGLWARARASSVAWPLRVAAALGAVLAWPVCALGRAKDWLGANVDEHELAPMDPTRTLESRSRWARVYFMLAGVLVNLATAALVVALISYLGASESIKQRDLVDALWYGGRGVLRAMWVFTTSFYGEFFLALIGQGSIEIGGLISLGQATGHAMQQGWVSMALLFVMLSLNIAWCNLLLPVPVCDGPQIAIVALEGARGRGLSARTRQRLYGIGMGLAIALMLGGMGADILRLR